LPQMRGVLLNNQLVFILIHKSSQHLPIIQPQALKAPLSRHL
jgi:hypothetical protein